jgi:hypothetical protein
MARMRYTRDGLLHDLFAWRFRLHAWLDRSAGYYAVLGMENIRNPSTSENFAVILKQQLKPLIVAVLVTSQPHR